MMRKFYILVIVLSLNDSIYPGGWLSKGNRSLEYYEYDDVLDNITEHNCSLMGDMFCSGNFTFGQIESLLTCEKCRKNAFFYLVRDFEKVGYEKVKKIAELFIQNGIGINDYDDAQTPLGYAIRFLNLDAVNLFISLGADVNKSIYKDTWVDCNKNRRNETALMKIIEMSDLCPTREKKLIDIVKSLLKANANPNISSMTITHSNWTLIKFPLIEAAYKRLKEIVYLLLEYGANPYKATFVDGPPHVKDLNGKTFFDYAKDEPEILAAYKKYLQDKNKVTHDTISKESGFNQDMPDDLVDMINEY